MQYYKVLNVRGAVESLNYRVLISPVHRGSSFADSERPAKLRDVAVLAHHKWNTFIYNTLLPLRLAVWQKPWVTVTRCCQRGTLARVNDLLFVINIDMTMDKTLEKKNYYPIQYYHGMLLYN